MDRHQMTSVLWCLLFFTTVYHGILAYDCERTICNPKAGDLLIGRESYLTASSTCGLNDIDTYCVVTGRDVQPNQKCYRCYSAQPYYADTNPESHRIENVVSRVPPDDQRWWQSVNGIHNVSISIRFETEFRFVYTQLRFKTYRPAAMYLERSQDFEQTWQRYAYFSEDCRRDFPGVPEGPRTKLTDVTCISEYSSILPSERGIVTFIAAPSDLHESTTVFSEARQDLSVMTNLRVVFTRLHTLGDWQVDDSENVRRKYYYAVYEWIVRGRCSCYGHAAKCRPNPNQPPKEEMVYGVCECQHNTNGTNCEFCADFYNDHPWRAATIESSNECKKCECHDHATRCHFDPLLYTKTKNQTGGHCDDCQHNTEGANCEYCKPGYFRAQEYPINHPDTCQRCSCEHSGSQQAGLCEQYTSLKDGIVAGQCICKKNVAGTYCERCKPGFWNFSAENPDGCQACPCDMLGTLNNMGCDPISGVCFCKRNVVGTRCDTCQDGYFNLTSSENGCSECGCSVQGSLSAFCNNGSGQCPCKEGFTGRTCHSVKDGYYLELPKHEIDKPGRIVIKLDPPKDPGNYTIIIKVKPEGFKPQDKWPINIIPYQPGGGDCKKGPPQMTSHTVDVSTDKIVLPNICLGPGAPVVIDVLSIPPNQPDLKILFPDVLIILQPHPNTTQTRSMISLCESERGRSPLQISKECSEYLRIPPATNVKPDQGNALSCKCNVTGSTSSVCDKLGGKCRCKPGVDGLLCNRCQAHSFGFDSTGCKGCGCHPNGSRSLQCDLVTGRCPCNVNVTGTQCDLCLPSYWNFPNCERCMCHGNSSLCDKATGYCINCTDFTEGRRCEVCQAGYYGNPVMGIPCRKCQCPGLGPLRIDHSEKCSLHPSGNSSVCHCLNGYAGGDCSECAMNFYGNPREVGGSCRPCDCWGNINPQVPNSCNNKTGECYKCLHNTVGFRCDQCAPGYYGEATRRECKPCICNRLGSVQANPVQCDRVSGICTCLPNVVGPQCHECLPNHFNLTSGTGCQACLCDPMGSVGSRCNLLSGQCSCKVGRGGRKCDQCEDLYWGNPADQCKPCNCDKDGSASLQCDRTTGLCSCKEGVTGKQCDRCDRGTEGQLPRCKPCGQCWKDWDRLVAQLEVEVDTLLNRTQRLNGLERVAADLPPELQQLFRQLTAIIDQAGRAALQVNASVTNAGLSRLRERLNWARQRLTDEGVTPESLQSETDKLNRSESDLNNSFEWLKSAQFLHDQLKQQLDKLEDEGRQIRVQDQMGAFREVTEAQRRSVAAEKRLRDAAASVAVVRPSLASLQLPTNQLNDLEKQNMSADSLRLKIDAIKKQLKEANALLCGDDGRDLNGDPTKCTSVCGGGGCQQCGGPTCQSAPVEQIRRTARALAELVIRSDLLIKNMKTAEDLKRKIQSDVDANQKAVKEAASLSLIVADFGAADYNKSLQSYLIVLDFVNKTESLAAEYTALVRQLTNARLKYNQTEVDDLSRQMEARLAKLNDVERILNETATNRRETEDLQKRATAAKRKAERVLVHVGHVETALSQANRSQDEARIAIAQSDEMIRQLTKTHLVINDSLKATEAAQENARKQLQQVTRPVETLANKADRLETDVTKLTGSMRGQHDQIDRAKADVKQVDNFTAELQTNMSTLVTTRDREKSELGREIQEFIKVLQQKLVQIEVVETETTQTERTMSVLDSELTTLTEEITAIGDSISAKSSYHLDCNP